MKENCFEISVNGLASGETTFLGHADKAFFVKFDNYEVLGADLRVTFVADKQPDFVDIDCNMCGTITVPCDRCMEPVAMPVSTGASFRLDFRGGSASAEDSEEYEEVFLPEGSDILDLGQDVYDYSLLALPLQKFHKEGECDPAALACLSEGEPAENEGQLDTPFANLAELFKK